MEGEFTISGGQVLTALAFLTTTFLGSIGTLFKMLLASKDRERDAYIAANTATTKVAVDSAVGLNNSAKSIEMLTQSLTRGRPHV